MPGVALVNTGDPELEYAFYEAERRVLGIQAKLHRWARDDPHRRFNDLYNLVCDPAFLLVIEVDYLVHHDTPSAARSHRTHLVHDTCHRSRNQARTAGNTVLQQAT